MKKIWCLEGESLFLENTLCDLNNFCNSSSMLFLFLKSSKRLCKAFLSAPNCLDCSNKQEMKKIWGLEGESLFFENTLCDLNNFCNSSSMLFLFF
jgi:hypothetical protein